VTNDIHVFGESFGGLLEMCYLCRRFSDNHKTEPDTNSKMEIYEKKHSFYAAVQLVKYAVFIALGIAMIRVGRDVLRHYPEWVWWLWLLVAAFFIIMSVAVLWSGINRYLDLHVNNMPAIIIEKDCLKIYSSGKYHIIRWSEVQDFKSVHMSKVRNMFYPIYKDDKRNGSRIGLQFHRDAFYCDYLTISEQELFELLKKHID
jgi:hypothetical protein